MSEPTEAKTIGFTPIYCSGKAMFHVSAGVPVSDALAQASDFLFLAKAFTEDAAYVKRHRPSRLGRALFNGDG